jgi:hypothetical protein
LPIFFSFCDEGQSEVSNWAIFQRDKPLLQVATDLPDAISECSPFLEVQPADCRKQTAVARDRQRLMCSQAIAPVGNALDGLRSKSRCGSLVEIRKS